MSKFKDSLNRWVTISLFEETAVNKDFVIMSLEDARRVYVEMGDPTGYNFSTEYLGGYRHWKAIMASPKLSEIIEEWNEEIEIKMQAEGLLRISAIAKEGHYQANKLLADRGWVQRAPGRPTKEEVEKNINRDRKLAKEVEHFLTPVEK